MTTMPTRAPAVRRGTIADRGSTPETHGYSNANDRRYQALVKPDERANRPQPTRSGGPRQGKLHHTLNAAQFRGVGRRKAE